jgi:hypothetical protein
MKDSDWNNFYVGAKGGHFNMAPDKVAGKGIRKKEPRPFRVQKDYFVEGRATLHFICGSENGI